MGFCSSVGFAQTQPRAHSILLYHTVVSDHTHYFSSKLQKKQMVLEYLKESFSYVSVLSGLFFQLLIHLVVYLLDVCKALSYAE